MFSFFAFFSTIIHLQNKINIRSYSSIYGNIGLTFVLYIVWCVNEGAGFLGRHSHSGCHRGCERGNSYNPECSDLLSARPSARTRCHRVLGPTSNYQLRTKIININNY
jgi:hypothetical protein